MIGPVGQTSRLATELREEFDRAFALPASTTKVQTSHLLAIRIGSDPYALPVQEITGLQVDRTIVPIPTAVPGLLGLAGIRGELVPVYSLAALLGYQHPDRATRWLALCGTGQTLGLAFDEFERHLNLFPAQIATADSANPKTEHIRAVAHADDGSRPVISIPSVAAEIARRCTTITVSKEK